MFNLKKVCNSIKESIFNNVTTQNVSLNAEVLCLLCDKYTGMWLLCDIYTGMLLLCYKHTGMSLLCYKYACRCCVTCSVKSTQACGHCVTSIQACGCCAKSTEACGCCVIHTQACDVDSHREAHGCCVTHTDMWLLSQRHTCDCCHTYRGIHVWCFHCWLTCAGCWCSRLMPTVLIIQSLRAGITVLLSRYLICQSMVKLQCQWNC